MWKQSEFFSDLYMSVELIKENRELITYSVPLGFDFLCRPRLSLPYGSFAKRGYYLVVQKFDVYNEVYDNMKVAFVYEIRWTFFMLI